MLFFIKGIQLFFLIFSRIFSIFATTTFWGATFVINRIRALSSFLVTILVFPLVKDFYFNNLPLEWSLFWLWLIHNIIIGLIIGFGISMFFSIFQMAGQFFSFQMGFSISQVLDPISQEEIPIIGQMIYTIALIVFISTNAHLFVIDLFFNSLKQIPLIKPEYTNLLKEISYSFGYIFSSSLQFSLPIVGTILIATLFIGLLAKASPQINAMLFGFPIYIGIGFILIALLAPTFISQMSMYIENIFSRIKGMFR